MIKEGRKDKYDFHMYTMREGSTVAYFQFVAFVTRLSMRQDFFLASYGSAVVLLQLADCAALLEQEQERIDSKRSYEFPAPRANTDGTSFVPGFDYDTRGIDHTDGKSTEDFINEAKKLTTRLKVECPIAKETWFLEFEIGLRENDSGRCAEAIKKLQFLYSNKYSTYRTLTGMNLLFQSVFT